MFAEEESWREEARSQGKSDAEMEEDRKDRVDRFSKWMDGFVEQMD